MSTLRRAAVWVAAWLVLVTGLQLWLNVDWRSLVNDRLPPEERKFNVAFLPVT
jgi:hypothetical protein